VSGAARVERIAAWLIRTACRRLPADVRGERYREWSAELPAILGDDSIRPPVVRALRALAFCVGISRTTRLLSRAARAGSRQTASAQWRSSEFRTRPIDIVRRLVVGLAVWLAFVAGSLTVTIVLTTGPRADPWPLASVAALGLGFAAFCLVDIARAADVRYLRKGAWVFICLVQIPLGGIIYLSIGRVGPARPVPPGDARP
jgi:hypothetical protein